MPSIVRRLVAVAAVVALTGCIGATPRDEFDAEVRARGGGLSNSFVTDGLDALAAHAGAAAWQDLDVLFLTVTPGSRSLTASARNPARDDFVDTIVVRDGEVVSSTPVQDADELPLDEIVVPLGAVALDRVEDIVDRALEAFDDPTGFVERLTVSRAQGDVRIVVELESDRVTATATFDADGNLTGIER